MKNFSEFMGEAQEAKKCPDGKYWCFQDKKCKKIPRGYHIGRSGYLAHDKKENGNGNGNGHSNGNGHGGNGNGNGGNGSSGNGGGNGGGGGD
tara:strand:- start:139 stop:414 length:276 start_codon:yes stop_codon:yes gene_type:complete